MGYHRFTNDEAAVRHQQRGMMLGLQQRVRQEGVNHDARHI
jgi:hypothetical protein